MSRVIAATLVSNLVLSAMAFVWLVVTSWWLQAEPYDRALAFASLLALVAIHILPFALPLAVLGWKLGWRLWLGHVLCGVIFGLKLGMHFFDSPVSFWVPFSTFAMAGALCGWIHWRIAIGRTAGNGHAIDTA